MHSHPEAKGATASAALEGRVAAGQGSSGSAYSGKVDCELPQNAGILTPLWGEHD